jgi:group I intron endonuclease
MANSGIYKIESKSHPDRIYIGSAVNIGNRWYEHLKKLKRNTHHSKKLQNHFNKYGESDLQFSILLGCDKEDLIKIEQYFLDSYNPWFNICKKAGNTLGLKGVWSKESIKRFSEYQKQNTKGEKNGFYHKHHSEESKALMRGPRFNVKKQKPYIRSKRPNLSIKFSGVNNPNAKLTQIEINEIAEKYKSGNYKRKELALEYNVSIDTIHRINKVFNLKLPYKNKAS